VLTIDGQAIGDSSAILAAIEERWPSRRCCRRTPCSAGALWGWRSSSTRSSDRHQARALTGSLLKRPELVKAAFHDGQTAAGRALIPTASSRCDDRNAQD